VHYAPERREGRTVVGHDLGVREAATYDSQSVVNEVRRIIEDLWMIRPIQTASPGRCDLFTTMTPSSTTPNTLTATYPGISGSAWKVEARLPI
jgi:hypothetical protein